MIVTVTASPAIDWTMHVDSFDLDAVNRITNGTREASGKGLNVSWALHREGVRTMAVFPGGGDTGRFMADALIAAAMPFVCVDTGQDVRTNITLVSPGHATKINEPGVALTDRQLQELARSAVATSAGADAVLLCGSLPPGAPAAFVGDLVGRIAAGGVPVIVDSSGEALALALESGPVLIKPNVHELAELTGCDIRTYGDVTAAARVAIDRGAHAVLASLGADGAMYVDADQALVAAARDIPFVNSVGAGDALLAGFISAPADPLTRLHRAVLWASSAVAHPSTLFPVRPEFGERIVAHPLGDPERALTEPSLPLVSSVSD